MWGPGAQGGFQNALSMGLQVGQMAGQAKRARDERNALSAYAKDPSEANFGTLADVRPDIAIQQREQMRARQQEQELAQVTKEAIGGSKEAMDRLIVLNSDRWKAVNSELKAKALEESKMLGGAALDLLQVPFEQRRGRILQYAQQFPQFAEQINNLAFLPPEEQELALRAVIVEAQMVDRLHQMERPQAFNVGPGEGRYERNPRTGDISTIVRPNIGNAPAFSPAGGVSVVRTGRDASGRRVVQLSDGTIQYAD